MWPFYKVIWKRSEEIPYPVEKRPPNSESLIKRRRREAIDRLEPVERELFLLFLAQRRALNTLVKQSRKFSRAMRGLFQDLKY